MARSIWKGAYMAPDIKKKLDKCYADPKFNPSATQIKTWARNTVITPDMVGITFSVHNGKDFIPVNVTLAMVGQKLGCFALTRKAPAHAGDKKIKKGR